MQRSLLLLFFYKSCLFSSWLPFMLPIWFSWPELPRCRCRTRGHKLPTDGGRWSDTDTCTLPEQDCTCWSVGMDRYEALQIKLHIVSKIRNTYVWNVEKVAAVLLFSATFNSAVHWTGGLLEIHPVNPGSVVIRGAATARFLCIESNGKLYSSVRNVRVEIDFSWQFVCGVERLRVKYSDHWQLWY